MLEKIKKKIEITSKILSLGAGWRAKLILLRHFAYLNLQLRFGGKDRPFSCWIKKNGRSAYVYFTGSMGEMLILVDILVDGSYEPKFDHTKTLFSNDIRTMLDLGANIGLTSVCFALSFPNISIDAYEPSPEMFALLKKNTDQFPRVRAFEKAIAPEEGTVEFNQSRYSLESSLFAARDSRVVHVPAITLDTAITNMGGKVDFLKIDIEGSEFEVFKRSKKLDDIRAIIGEAHTEQAGREEKELYQLLSSFPTIKIYNPNNLGVFGFYAAHA